MMHCAVKIKQSDTHSTIKVPFYGIIEPRSHLSLDHMQGFIGKPTLMLIIMYTTQEMTIILGVHA